MKGRLGVLGAGAVATACCAGLPALLAATGLTVGAAAGVAAGLLAAVACLIAVSLVRTRRRGSSDEDPGTPVGGAS